MVQAYLLGKRLRRAIKLGEISEHLPQVEQEQELAQPSQTIIKVEPVSFPL
jgi:hypothetical protein